jgi:hypothetical protein
MAISKQHRKLSRSFLANLQAFYTACDTLQFSDDKAKNALQGADETVFYFFYDRFVLGQFIKDKSKFSYLSNNSPQSVQSTKELTSNTIEPNQIHTKSSKSKSKNIRCNLMIDSDLLDALKHHASATDRSLSSLIRISARKYLDSI